MMNDQKIYQYLARKPDSRAQDIADVMNVELKDASDALRSLVDVGDIVRYSGVARNGVQAQLYRLSDTFMKSHDGIAALKHAAAVVVEAPPVAPAPVVTPAPPAPLAIPVLAQSALPEPTTIKTSKVEKALAHVQKGPATDDELRLVMGIAKGAAPKAWLASAIKSGRIHKGVNGWTKGVAPGGAVPFCTPVGKPKDEVKAQFTDVPLVVPPFIAPVPMVAEAGPIDALKLRSVERIMPLPLPQEIEVERRSQVVGSDAPVFRCGMWSDGALELQRDGVTIAVLQRGEVESMEKFMCRVLQWPGKVSA